MRVIVLILIIFAGKSITLAQQASMGSGARSYALGGMSAAFADAWSAFNNPAAMPFYGKSAAMLQVENRFSMAQLNRAAMGANFHSKGGDIGLTLNYEGYSRYNSHVLGLSFARQLGKGVSAAVQMNLNGLQVAGYGSEYRVTGTLAFFVKPIKDLSIGLNFDNITRTAWNSNEELTQYLPSIARLGVEYKVEENVILAAECVQELEMPTMLKAGVEYGFAKSFYARAGFTTINTMFNFGFGYKADNWGFDMAAGIHQYLGFSPRLSFQWEF